MSPFTGGDLDPGRVVDSDAHEDGDGGTEGGGTENGERFSIAPRYLAGWLFADLFLVLFIIALGLNPSVDETEKDRTERPSAPPSSDTPKKATAGGIDPAYQPVSVRLGDGATVDAPGRKALRPTDAEVVGDAVVQKVEQTGNGRKIGMLLTFGGAPQSGVESAQTLARHTNTALLARHPELFCGKNVGTRDFWDGDPFEDKSDPLDAVRVEIYYTNSCQERPGTGGGPDAT